MLPVPSPADAAFGLAKTAGFGDIGMAALFGALFGRAGKVFPQIDQLRLTNPALYDAALAASVAAALEATQKRDEQPQAPGIPMIQPPGYLV